MTFKGTTYSRQLSMVNWKLIAAHPRYEVSDSGLIRNTKSGRIKTSILTEYEYYRAVIGKSGETYFVHHLVANAFLTAPTDEQTEINHIDGDGKNNSVENLEWCTRSENVRDSHKRKRRQSKPPPVKVETTGCVYQYNSKGVQVATHETDTAAAISLKVSQPRVSYVTAQAFDIKALHRVNKYILSRVELTDAECKSIKSHFDLIRTIRKTGTPILGFPTYIATRDAIVLNSKTNHILTQMGTKTIKVAIEDKRLGLAKLIARTFLGERPTDRHKVMHLDRDSCNCHVDNLRWELQGTIQKHYLAGKRPTTCMCVYVYDTEQKFITSFESGTDAAVFANVVPGTIASACSNNEKKTSNYGITKGKYIMRYTPLKIE